MRTGVGLRGGRGRVAELEGGCTAEMAEGVEDSDEEEGLPREYGRRKAR